MAYLAMQAEVDLVEKGFDPEIIDIRTLKPLDKELIIDSVKKTGRLLVADGGWKSFGASSEIISTITEEAFEYLKSPPVKVALPDVPAPASRTLEKAYYPAKKDIIQAAQKLLEQ